jgi:ribonuclease HII
MRATLAPELALSARTAGVDEAGRGPWAGPVVAAAVVLPGQPPVAIADSKALSQAQREASFDWLMAHAEVGIGQASVAEIDALNIRAATFLAMRRAVTALPAPPLAALVDGNALPGLGIPEQFLVKGDALSLSVAAASIIAKVTRDAIMRALDAEHPGYGWARNKGYGTAAHAAALTRLGPTPHHRRSFKPVSATLGKAI